MPLVASSADDFTMFATALGVKGASITIPYKVDLSSAPTQLTISAERWARSNLSAAAARAGRRQHRCERFPRSSHRKISLRGARAAILGTRRAARAAAVALESVGSRDDYGRAGRRRPPVARIVGGAGALFPVPAKSWDVLVNTTPLGMYPDVDRTPFDGEFDGRVVYDLVYNPLDTRLLKDAAAAGCAAVGGLDMLVAQAEDQSEWWLGRRPPANLMRQAAMRGL